VQGHILSAGGDVLISNNSSEWAILSIINFQLPAQQQYRLRAPLVSVLPMCSTRWLFFSCVLGYALFVLCFESLVVINAQVYKHL
jgi:hypothetical protein